MKSFSLSKLLVGVALVATTANAAEVKMSGSIEGGAVAVFGHPTTTTNDSAFYLDHAALNTLVTINDKTKVVINKAFSMNGSFTNAAGFGTAAATHSTATFFNALGTVATTGTIAFAVNEAYLAHECASGVNVMGGMFATPFGIEGMWGRYDYTMYYYSFGRRAAVANGWNYDVGFGVTLSEFMPGKLEVAVTDGRVNTTVTGGVQNSNPAVAARYHVKLEVGDMEITPVVSVYASRFQGGGGPNDLGLSGGLMWKMGMLMLNAEFIDVQEALTPGATKGSSRSIWFEPGVDLGMFSLNGKVDLARTAGVNDTNFGLTLAKKWDNWRLRAGWMYNSTGAGTTKWHDVRVLLGTSF